jgi:hypothetical protein
MRWKVRFAVEALSWYDPYSAIVIYPSGSADSRILGFGCRSKHATRINIGRKIEPLGSCHRGMTVHDTSFSTVTAGPFESHGQSKFIDLAGCVSIET